jgi:cyclase
MLKKRLIGIVLVKDGWAVQSFGYRRCLPLGKPECLVENLDRWGADEIFVLNIDRSTDNIGPDFELLKKLGKLGLDTPLVYGGGIRSLDDGLKVIRLGADRLVVDALMHDDQEIIRSLSQKLGTQAVIGSMPVSMRDQKTEWLDYRNNNSVTVSNSIIESLNSDIISELLVIDWQHEGFPNSFNQNLIASFSGLLSIPLIAFGGLSEPEQIKKLLLQPNIAAVAVGNFLSYEEHAIQNLKKQLASISLRPPTYQSKYRLIP